MKTKLIVLLFIIFNWEFSAFTQTSVILPNIKSQLILSSDTNGGPILNSSVNFGSSVASIGDLDNDGVDDIVIGSNTDDDGGASNLEYGAVYVCFMNSNGTIKSSVKIGNSTSGIGSDIVTLDYFGSSVTGLGDLNGDGHEDIAVGSYGADVTSYSGSGAVYIIFLDSTASILSYKRIARSVNGGPTNLQAGSQFGFSLCNLGDVNDDGINDILIGGNQHDGANTSNSGAVWVLMLTDTGSASSFSTITNGTQGFASLAASDFFGTSVAATGDLDDDGVPDFISSALGDDEWSANTSCIYAIYLNTSGGVKSYKKYIQPFSKEVIHYNEQSSFARGLGVADLNDDGLPEFISGSHLENRLYIMSLDSSENILDVKIFGQNMHWDFTIPNWNDRFSYAISTWNNGEKSNLLIGAPLHDHGLLTNSGAAWILELDTLLTELHLGDAIGYDKYGELSDAIVNLDGTDLFGADVCELGDVDGDGYNDIAVGAHGDDDGGSARGAVYIIFLDSLQHKKSVQKISSTTGGFGSGLDDLDQFGFSVTGPGDLDGDTIPDLIASAHLDDDGGTDRGAFYIIFLNNDGTVKSKIKVSDITGGFTGTLANSDNFGKSVAAIGDVNNDGINDIAVGEDLDDDGGTNRGAVWILFMSSADTVKGCQKISDTQGDFTETFSGNSVSFGTRTARAGDLNFDGKEDLLVASASMDGTGATYILFLDTLGKVDSFVKINNQVNNFPDSLQQGKSFGVPCLLDDLDGNGIPEIAISQINFTSFGTDKGCVWICFPDSSFNILEATQISEYSGGFNGGILTSGMFGNDLCTYRDADSVQHLFVGSRQHSEVTSSEGAVYKLSIPTYLNEILYRSNNFNYAQLFRELNGSYYKLNVNRKLRFRFEGEYSTHDLKWNLFSDKHSLVASDNTITSYTNAFTGNTKAMSGENYFEIKIPCIGLLGTIGSGFYILETSNEKNEKRFLRIFIDKNPCIILPSPK